MGRPSKRLTIRSMAIEDTSEPRNPAGKSVHLQKVLTSASQELRELARTRAEVRNRIRTIKRTIDGLVAMFGKEILSKDLQDLLYPSHPPGRRPRGARRMSRRSGDENT